MALIVRDDWLWFYLIFGWNSDSMIGPWADSTRWSVPFTDIDMIVLDNLILLDDWIRLCDYKMIGPTLILLNDMFQLWFCKVIGSGYALILLNDMFQLWFCKVNKEYLLRVLFLIDDWIFSHFTRWLVPALIFLDDWFRLWYF